MTKVFSSVVFATVLGMAPLLSHAAFADFSTFAAISGTDGDHTVTPGLASISGVAALSGRVTGLSSFEWSFSDSTHNDGFASFLLTPVGGISSLVNLATDTSAGFQTYTFATPFTGVIRFTVDSHDVDTQATLDLRNLAVTAVSAVPEPETYAMLLAGLGLIGFLGRRRSGPSHSAPRLAA